MSNLLMPSIERVAMRPLSTTQVKPRWQLDASLVLYLPLWNLSGDVFLSQDAYGHTCTRYGATPTGQGGMYIISDDYLTVPPAPFSSITDCTLIIWFRYATKASDAVMFAYYGDANNRFNPHVATATKKVINEMRISGTGYTAASDNAIDANVWYHGAFCLGSGGVRLFLNGKLQAASNTNTSSFANITATELSIGRLGSLGVYWQDYIGEVSLYNRALTEHEIWGLYNETKGRYGG